MAGMGDGASRARPSPEPLRIPLPPARAAAFVDGSRASGSPVAAAAPGARTAEATETPYSVAFSVPASPSGLHLGACASVARSVAPSPQPAEHQHALPQLLNQAWYHSQPALTIRTEEPPPLQRVRTVSRSDSTTRDHRFDQFKTLSGRLERQLSNLRGVAVDIEPANDFSSNKMISEEEQAETDGGGQVPTVDRYFAALEGPELIYLAS